MKKLKMKRIIITTILILFFGLPPHNPVFAKTPIVVTAGIPVDPATLDAAQSIDGSSDRYTFNIFDTLVSINPVTAAIEPALALSWEVKEKGTLWVFKLRQNVKFQDHSPCDADAVVFSFQRQLDSHFKYRYYEFVLFREIFPTLKEVKKIDTYTVAFHLTQPFYPFLNSLTSACGVIVSPTAVKKYGKNFSFHPVGTGPFQLKTWQKGKRIVLERNPLYWREKPFIDEFKMIINANAPTLHRLFNEQELDISFQFSISRAMGLRLLHWVKVHQSRQPGTNFFAFNFKNKFIKKKNIRKALMAMWDSRYLNYVYQQYVFPSSSFIPPGMLGYEKEEAPSFYSLEKAREYLKKEHCQEKITLTLLLLNENELGMDFVSLYANNLKKIGIHLKVLNLKEDEYNTRIAAGNFDMTLSGWVADYPDTHSLIFSMFSEKLHESGMPNMASYSEKNILPMIQKADGVANDLSRSVIYKKINRIIREEVLCIPISHISSNFYYNQSKLSNVQVDSLGILHLRMLKKNENKK